MVAGRPDAHVESLMQAMEDINLADLSRDQLKDLPESLLQFHEKLTQKKAEVCSSLVCYMLSNRILQSFSFVFALQILRRKSESISSDWIVFFVIRESCRDYVRKIIVWWFWIFVLIIYVTLVF